MVDKWNISPNEISQLSSKLCILPFISWYMHQGGKQCLWQLFGIASHPNMTISGMSSWYNLESDTGNYDTVHNTWFTSDQKSFFSPVVHLIPNCNKDNTNSGVPQKTSYLVWDVMWKDCIIEPMAVFPGWIKSSWTHQKVMRWDRWSTVDLIGQ